MPTMSSLPSAMAWRAVATSLMRAAWNTGNFVGGAHLAGEVEMRRGLHAGHRDDIGKRRVVIDVALMILRKSMRPESLKRRQMSMPSSRVSPCSQSSSAAMRRPTRKSGPTRHAHGFQHAEAETQAVVERAAIIVAAAVGGRRPEAVHQMAVALEFETIEAGGLHAFGRIGIVLDDALDVPVLHLLWKGAVGGLADRRGGEDREPVGLVPRGAAAEMGELDHHRGAMVVALLGQASSATARSRPCRRGDCRRRAANPARRRPIPPSWSARCRPSPSPHDRGGSGPWACRLRCSSAHGRST